MVSYDLTKLLNMHATPSNFNYFSTSNETDTEATHWDSKRKSHLSESN